MHPEKLSSPDPEEVREEAQKLGEQQREKTFIERHFSEYQTRETNIPGKEIPRGEVFRFERGQLYKAYMNLRKQIREAESRGEDITSKKALLKEMRERAKDIETDLDELNGQFYENLKDVDIETEFGHFTVPVTVLDLKKDSEGETIDSQEDKRVPYIFLAGIATNVHQNAALPLAMALKGHRVYITTQPEQPSVKKPDNFGELLSKSKDLRIHAAIAKEIIKTIGLTDVNVVGYSTGATTALELAADSEVTQINDLTVIEPLGIKEKGIVNLGMELGLVQGGRTMLSAESRMKGMAQGSKEGQGSMPLFWETAKIISKKQFPPEKLADMNFRGRFQVWMGKDSSIMDTKLAKSVFGEAEVLRLNHDPSANPLEFYEVGSSDHLWPLTNALGLARMLDQEKPEEQVTKVKISELENSATLGIIKDIKK